MSDETIIRRVTEKLDRYDGPDRRAPPPTTYTDLLKWVPLLVVTLSGYGTYVRLQGDVARLQADVSELKTEMKTSHSALWKKVAE